MATVVHWGKYFPPDFGGIENVTSSLASGAALLGHNVTVVCFQRRGKSVDKTADGVQVLRAPVDMLKSSQPVGLIYFRWLLREGRRADLVHLHAPNLLASLAALLVGRRPRVVVHWHSDVIGKGLLGRALRPLERAMLRRADIIICTSAAYAKASNEVRSFARKVKVIPIGVADGRRGDLHPNDDLPDGLSQKLAGRRIVLSVGRLVPYKGFSVLVEAARYLEPDAAIVIVGTGPLEIDLAQRINHGGLGDKVILAGRQSEGALKALFARAYLFCLPSVERSEAFGVVLAEAMSHSLPVVATDIPGSGVPWVNRHGESGFNVPVGDARALAEACNKILASTALKERLSRGARQRYESEFAEGVFCARVQQLYLDLLREANCSPLTT